MVNFTINLVAIVYKFGGDYMRRMRVRNNAKIRL